MNSVSTDPKRPISAGARGVASGGREAVVDFAKGVGIIGVVAHHLANRRFGDADRPWIGLGGSLCDWAVPLFILVSGYVHARSLQHRPRSLGDQVKSRVRRLLMPYLACALGYAAFYALLVRLGLLSDSSTGSAGLLPLWRDALLMRANIGEQLYFLPVLFVVSTAALFFSGVNLKNISHRWYATGVFALWCVVGHAAGDTPLVFWSWFMLSMGVLIFLAGQGLARAERVPAIFVASALVVALALVFGQAVFFNFLYALVLFSGLLLLRPQAAGLERVGQASGTIFLYHTPFFIQPLLIGAAKRLPDSLHVAAAYGILLLTIIFFTAVHFLLKRSRFQALAY